MHNAIKEKLMPRKNLGALLTRAARIVLLALLLAGFLNSTEILALEAYNRHEALFGVSFPEEKEGWACGDWGTIWHTGDGGLTWAAQKSGTDSTLSAIFFIDSQTGWTVGKDGVILHTADGGQNWIRQESPVDFFHRDVFFVTVSKGWIASEQTHILYTEDGGKTWQVQYSDEIYNLVGIAFSDEMHGWTVGEYGFTYHTGDGGKNWEHQAGYFRVSDYTGDIETGVFLFDVIALDAMTALAVGADGVVTKTVNGGKTWISLESGIPKALFFGAAYNGLDTIVIGGKGVYLYSEDRGQKWNVLQTEPSMEYRWLYGFCNIGSSRFAAVGEDGAIYLGELPGRLQRINY